MMDHNEDDGDDHNADDNDDTEILGFSRESRFYRNRHGPQE